MEKILSDHKSNHKCDIRDYGPKKEVVRRLPMGKIQGEKKQYNCYGKQQICKLHSTEQFLIRISTNTFLSSNVDDKYIWFPRVCNVCLYENQNNTK